ncbi:hypothetical protein Dalk_4615 [Desulfatibacillum aliphaticivorans]|uniref:Core-binding (CB) domain-containing protein n=1 Tax=Desulfatibacillum aliphaticivorans TaxID=218208 RepID=B8FNL2_DESAL|nr:hypothetical protein [Desulfatibacillum aliphaticivorans]ACL06293.1 hypothetical protein Dalk_4615 [Desulfatibacillum aliphaticivorans]
MLGNIYTSQKCRICGGPLIHDERKRGLFCREHPEVQATGGFKIQMGNRKHGTGVSRGATSYAEAARILNGMRYQKDIKQFDPRDHRRENPLAFDRLADRWVEFRKKQIKGDKRKKKHWNNINNYMNKAKARWGAKNVKEIDFMEFEEFFLDMGLSSKSIANARSVYNSFFRWLIRAKILKADQMPDLPEVEVEMGFRKMVSQEVQWKLLDEVYRLTRKRDIKIWLGIKWLATYFSIRPGAMLSLQEWQLDRVNGTITIPKPKQKKPQIIRLLDEDVELLRSMPEPISQEMPFFRHATGHGGVEPGTQYGPKYFNVWWKRACENLGVEGVPVYPGTKHSTVTALRDRFSPEKIRKTAQIKENSAFDRYFQAEAEDALEIWEQTRPPKPKKKGEVVNIKR